jgi:hypothetical protein
MLALLGYLGCHRAQRIGSHCRFDRRFFGRQRHGFPGWLTNKGIELRLHVLQQAILLLERFLQAFQLLLLCLDLVLLARAF